MMYTPKQFQESINWNTMTTWGARSNQALTCKLGPFTVVQTGECDHETCYETHEWTFVFGLGEQRFAREATYSSYDGLKWSGSVYEVKPVEVVKTDWRKVETIHWKAKDLEKALEALFRGEDNEVRYRDNYKAPEQPWVHATLTSWSAFVECMEEGALLIPAIDHRPFVGFQKPNEFEDLDSTELECAFTVGDQTFIKQGTWVSHDGTYWEGDVLEVTVAQKTINHWVTVK
jgi:hypothetical protein